MSLINPHHPQLLPLTASTAKARRQATELACAEQGGAPCPRRGAARLLGALVVRWGAPLAATLVALTPSAPARAEPAQAEPANADELHRRASEAFRAGDFAKAEAHLTTLWGMERSARAACDLGLTLSKREDWARAAAMMEHCMGLAGARAGERTRAAHRAAMEQVQRLDVVTKPDGAEISVSGAARGDKSLYLAPGPYELVVSHPGYVTVTRQLTAVAGERATHELTLERDPAAPTASAPPASEPEVPEVAPSEGGPDYTTRNLVVLGAGVVAVGSFVTAVIFNAKAYSASDEWKQLGGESCRAGSSQANCREAAHVADDWKGHRSTRNVFLGVGAGFAVLGAAAYLLWPEPAPKSGWLTHEFNVGAGGGQWVVSASF